MKKKLIIIIPVAIALLVFVGLYVFLNYTDDRTNLTVLEKRWISNNSGTKYDLEIVNNVPIFSMAGTGVIFDFIDNFEMDTELEFNKISYLKTAEPTTTGLRFRILNNDTALTDNDLLLAEDGYVAISAKNVRYDSISEIQNEVIGVFTEDAGELTYYLKTGQNLTFKTYDTIETMIADYEAGTITMMVIPQILYLDQTLSNEAYYTNYYFTEMSKKIVLTLTEDNEELNNIVRKYFEKWKQDDYVVTYNKEYLNYYASERGLNDKAKADLISRSYVYGYVENTPYEVTIDGTPSGIASEYVARMQRLTNIEFTYQKYDTVEELKQAIDNGEVDIYFNYFGYQGSNYTATLSPMVEEYVVLARLDSQEVINTFEGLKNKQVMMLKNSLLTSYIQENSKANVKEVDTLDDLTSGNHLIIVDREIYNYYRNSKFSKYEVLYEDRMTNEYNFMVKTSDQDFRELFSYIIMTNSYYNYRISGLNSLNLSLLERTSFEELYLIILGIILLPLLILTAIYIILKRKKKVKEVKKEDRRKYTDILTSLKNRNYLNLNMKTWEESKVYPQAVVIVDLNNVKYVNDNYGHEAGDQLITTAASILVNTQLENSEIIRTDGNEFLVYLVGYSEKQVDTYCKKLNKELKELPHGFGAATGFSMITDDIKTIDDAINEATLEMRTNKEKIK
ncbi:MAG TPA: GGDEF domain-containing protein [Candidatus Scybalousia intestinigallinarum]|nr:GGDEF domain-containing protein [Candidatus Scybalousia intestinigallinarum]